MAKELQTERKENVSLSSLEVGLASMPEEQSRTELPRLLNVLRGEMSGWSDRVPRFLTSSSLPNVAPAKGFSSQARDYRAMAGERSIPGQVR